LANQVASGLGLTLFGLGLSALIGQGYVGIKPPPTPRLDIAGLSDAPVIGPILFSHDPILYFGIALTAAVWAVLKYTRAGLILRAVGESHDAAHALGYKVVRIRTLAGLHQPDPRAAMDRRDDRWHRLDCAGVGGLCQLEAMARFAGCLSFRRCHGFAA